MMLLLGILCGIALSLFFSFGPAFFGLIQNSIQYGFRKAMAFAVGVSLSDIVVVFLMLTVLKNVDMEAALHNVYVASIGGAAIAAMGIHNFRKKAVAAADTKSRIKFRDDGNTRIRHLILQGFVLNIFNPFIWIYWVSVIALFSGEMELVAAERYVFFSGLLVGTLGCDLLKCRLASLLQTWFTARVLNFFNKGVGLVMIAFAVYLIVAMILYQTNPKIREKEQENTPQGTKFIEKTLKTVQEPMTRLNGHADSHHAAKPDTAYFKPASTL